MDIGGLIASHGYWILVLGCLLEGETVLLLAGFAAHQGYLDPVAVVALGSAAGFIGDQLLFWLGRQHGTALATRYPAVGRQALKVNRLVNRWPHLVIIGIRFAYGLRIAGPLLIGASGISAARFAALNLLGAVIWAVLFTSLGWVFGQAAQAVLGRLTHVEGWLILAIAGLGLAVTAARHARARPGRQRH